MKIYETSCSNCMISNTANLQNKCTRCGKDFKPLFNNSGHIILLALVLITGLILLY